MLSVSLTELWIVKNCKLGKILGRSSVTWDVQRKSGDFTLLLSGEFVGTMETRLLTGNFGLYGIFDILIKDFRRRFVGAASFGWEVPADYEIIKVGKWTGGRTDGSSSHPWRLIQRIRKTIYIPAWPWRSGNYLLIHSRAGTEGGPWWSPPISL